MFSECVEWQSGITQNFRQVVPCTRTGSSERSVVQVMYLQDRVKKSLSVRQVESRFAETLTLTLNPNPNFGESGFGESGRRRQARTSAFAICSNNRIKWKTAQFTNVYSCYKTLADRHDRRTDGQRAMNNDSPAEKLVQKTPKIMIRCQLLWHYFDRQLQLSRSATRIKLKIVIGNCDQVCAADWRATLHLRLSAKHVAIAPRNKAARCRRSYRSDLQRCRPERCDITAIYL